MRKTIAALALLGSMLALSESAIASSHSVGTCYFKTMIVNETVKKPVVTFVTKYDHCGKPYQARIVTYKLAHVAVKKQVKICH